MTSTPEEQAAVRKKGDWIAPLVYLAIFVAGAYIVYVAIAGLTGGASLGAGAVAVEARVTGARTVTHPKRETTYEVQYAFNVGAQTYTYRDPTGRTNLWVSLTREAWDAARANGTTPVRYLPSDPWTSRAVHAAGDPVESNVIGLVVGLILMLPATLWLVRLVRRRRVATA
ncbi:MAG TPA: DUF3592 domain-containing protein [Burkholderiales bacterium]|nr:DUF3592 domain-containing protein [Burkholderiales bacterium]